MAERKSRFNLPSFTPGETPSSSPTESPEFDGTTDTDPDQFQRRRSYSSLGPGEIPDGLSPKERGRFVVRGIYSSFETAGREIPDGSVQHELRKIFSNRDVS